MKNIWRILILRYAALAAAVSILIFLPLLAVPEVRHIWWIFLSVIALLMAVIIAASVWSERTVTGDLRGFSDAAAGLASGDLDRRVAEPEIKEFADLARDFNIMAEQVRLRMEEAATERGKLEAVLRNISTGVMVTDSERRIVMLNPAAEAILGVSSEKARGRRIIEVFSNRELDVTVAGTAGGDSSDVEIEIIYPQRMFLHVKSRPVTASDGEVIATVSAIEDITAVKRLDQVRQDFVANVSHELRTPVATIKALTDSLQGGALDERETAARFLKDLGKESSRLAQLIEDLLTLGKLEARGSAPKMEEFNLEELVRECLESKVKLAVDYEVTVDLSSSGESRKIRADRRLLGTAIDNLLDNAIKYNRPGGKVNVLCKYDQEGVTIRVEDNGVGIPRDELPRIFERFYRVDKARSREAGGTGLGLSIVKHVAELHGGTVSVESVEDEGSTFSIHLFGC
jgi:two-component system phosphate regulon sensor histidine kinase PhoR